MICQSKECKPTISNPFRVWSWPFEIFYLIFVITKITFQISKSYPNYSHPPFGLVWNAMTKENGSTYQENVCKQPKFLWKTDILSNHDIYKRQIGAESGWELCELRRKRNHRERLRGRDKIWLCGGKKTEWFRHGKEIKGKETRANQNRPRFPKFGKNILI